MDNATPRPFYPLERDPVSILQEDGWATEAVWMGAENLAPTGIRSPDRQASSDVPHATKSDLIYIQIPSPYRAVNTLRLCYTNQSVNVV